MSLCTTKTITRWVSRFRENRSDFSSMQIPPMVEVLSCPIHKGLMDHMQSRWNPATSAFHIGSRRICPTVEEFKALLQIKGTEALSLIPYASSSSLVPLLQQEVGFAPFVCKLLFKGNSMDLQGWSSIAFDEERVQQIPESSWRLTAAIMILAHFFLSPSDDKPSTKVFEVACKLREQEFDISGMILAETLMGLNEQSRAHKVEASTRGSPHTLNLWYLEKLAFLSPIPAGLTLDTRRQKARFKAAEPQAVITDQHELRNTLPWYNIPKMMYSTDGMLKVTIYGLVSTVSYDTTHLYAQYGRKDLPAAIYPTSLADGMITHKMHNNYLNKLSSTLKIEVLNNKKVGLEQYFAAPPRPTASTSQPSRKKQKTEGVSAQSPPAAMRRRRGR